MRQNDWTFTYTDYAMIDDKGSELKPSVGVPEYIDYFVLLKNTAITCLTVMLDTHRIKDLRMPDMPSGQDYALWFQILREGTVAHGIDKVLAKYRVLPGCVSRNKLKAARRMWRLYREFEHLSVARSSWYFLNYAVNAGGSIADQRRGILGSPTVVPEAPAIEPGLPGSRSTDLTLVRR